MGLQQGKLVDEIVRELAADTIRAARIFG